MPGGCGFWADWITFIQGCVNSYLFPMMYKSTQKPLWPPTHDVFLHLLHHHACLHSVNVSINSVIFVNTLHSAYCSEAWLKKKKSKESKSLCQKNRNSILSWNHSALVLLQTFIGDFPISLSAKWAQVGLCATVGAAAAGKGSLERLVEGQRPSPAGFCVSVSARSSVRDEPPRPRRVSGFPPRW